MEKPIFILGAPRSGTTFLASLMEKTNYGRPFETHFITRYYKNLHKFGDLNNFDNFNRLIRNILSERAVAQWALDLDIMSFYKEFKGDVNFSKIIDQLCLRASKKKGFKAWGDKTPHYLGDLNIIYKLFPHSKFLYIVRDGRDVALSLLEKDWGPNNIYYCAKYWASLNRDHDEIDLLKASDQLYFLQYEKLLDNVDFYIKDIYQFLGMDFNEDDLQNLSKTVRKGNYDKWKNKMSKQQIQVFENIAGNTLKKFNYETTYGESRISWPLVWGYKIHHLMFRARHLFIINIVDSFKIKFLGKQPFSE